jgi:hypothetical protein
MSILSALRKMHGVSVTFMGALSARADEQRGRPQSRYYAKVPLFVQCFNVTPGEMAAANTARRRRIGNCFSQRRADEALAARVREMLP